MGKDKVIKLQDEGKKMTDVPCIAAPPTGAGKNFGPVTLTEKWFTRR
jgi:hypothetical protein